MLNESTVEMCGFICYLKLLDLFFKLEKGKRLISICLRVVRKFKFYSLKIFGREKCFVENIYYMFSDVLGVFSVLLV